MGVVIFFFVDVHMEPQTLSHMSSRNVYKPLTQINNTSSLEEILISETEIQRLYSQGENFCAKY